MLALWTGSLILDEWNQWLTAPRTFVIDLWNAYDYVALSLTTLGLLFKLGPLHNLMPSMVLAATQSELLGTGAAAAPIVAGRVLRGGGYRGETDSLDQHLEQQLGEPLDEDGSGWASLSSHLVNFDDNLLAIVNVLVWCRVLQHYSTQREIGVLIIMIINMMTDMKIWILLSTVFTLAFLVTFVALAGDAPVETTLTSSMWAMFGEFYVDYFRTSSGRLGESLLWIFAMVSNVLLVNLLIAMMSETYQKIKDKADVEWKFGRVSAVLEAIERTHPVPPPFSAVLLLFRFVQWVLVHRCAGVTAQMRDDAEDERAWGTGGRLHALKVKRENVAKQTLQMHRRQDDERNEVSGEGRLRRIEKLVLDLLIFSEDHEREIKYLREEMSPNRKKTAVRPPSQRQHQVL